MTLGERERGTGDSSRDRAWRFKGRGRRRGWDGGGDEQISLGCSQIHAGGGQKLKAQKFGRVPTVAVSGWVSRTAMDLGN